MSEPSAHISLITLGVGDLHRSIAFYEALGFARRLRAAEGVGFFAAGACTLAVWPADELAGDANIAAPAAPSHFRGVALAWNCMSEANVDAVIGRALKAGGTVPKPARKTSWGGYAGYFADPDGHLWEVAHNPGFALADGGRVTVPD